MINNKCKILFSTRLYKELDRLPRHILSKLDLWMRSIELIGLSEVRKNPGFHDEPLHGPREGQRSVRLSRSYRAIYVENDGQEITIIKIIEVSKHVY